MMYIVWKLAQSKNNKIKRNSLAAFQLILFAATIMTDSMMRL